jgi:hypothetical protein
MKKFLLYCLFAIVLGTVLAIVGIVAPSWQFFVISIPVIGLYLISQYIVENKKDSKDA